jgi:hypothetical protein
MNWCNVVLALWTFQCQDAEAVHLRLDNNAMSSICMFHSKNYASPRRKMKKCRERGRTGKNLRLPSLLRGDDGSILFFYSVGRCLRCMGLVVAMKKPSISKSCASKFLPTKLTSSPPPPTPQKQYVQCTWLHPPLHLS